MDRLVSEGLPLNPSSLHAAGQRAKALLASARAEVALLLDVPSKEVIFTSGATESLNLLIRGLVLPGPGSILCAATDHRAVVETVKGMTREGYAPVLLRPGLEGRLSAEALEKALDPSVRLIVLSAANSETGILQDVEGYGKVAERAGIPLVIDAVALLGRAAVRLPPGVSGLALSGHKAHGPTGTGVAIVRGRHRLRPLLLGGGQEHGRRSGTEAVVAWHGLAEAMRFAYEDLEETTSRMEGLRDLFEELVLSGYPEAHVIGNDLPRLCNTSCLAFPGEEGERLVIELDRLNICVSHGSACSAGAHEPSPSLRALGIPESWVKSALRISLGRNTQEWEVRKAAEALLQVLQSSCAVR
jgi:cysteine desulfurase